MNFIENSTFVYALVAIGLIANLVKLPGGILNMIKRGLGALWMIAAPLVTYSFISEGMTRMNAPTANSQTVIQWVIIIIIFLPIMVGLFIHGLYGVQGQYSSSED
jgi:hypothetical protein